MARVFYGVCRVRARRIPRRRFQLQVAIRARCAAVENSKNPGVAVDIKRLQPRTSRGHCNFSMMEFEVSFLPRRQRRFDAQRNDAAARFQNSCKSVARVLYFQFGGGCGLGAKTWVKSLSKFCFIWGVGAKSSQTQSGRQARPALIFSE